MAMVTDEEDLFDAFALVSHTPAGDDTRGEQSSKVPKPVSNNELATHAPSSKNAPFRHMGKMRKSRRRADTRYSKFDGSESSGDEIELDEAAAISTSSHCDEEQQDEHVPARHRSAQ